MDFAAETAELATPDSKPFVEVGAPSVKKTTTFVAPARPLEASWEEASSRP